MSTRLLRAFTEAVTECERRKTGVSSGYQTADGTRYDSYMDNDAWAAMLREMAEAHRSQYGEGGGGELREEKGRPPKMASFISSSRMIYLLSKDIPGFVFEAKRPTLVGGTANLDGYLAQNGTVYYVEAKLREPYSHKAIQRIKENYRDVYAWLRERMGGTFECVMEHCGEREMDVVFSSKGTVAAAFDIKQMICHLLGVAAYHLQQEEVPESVCFLYLLYDPCKLSLDGQYADEILRIYQETTGAAKAYHFETMFAHIVDYLIACHALPADHAAKLKEAFRFRLCSQDTYRGCFE